MVCNVYRREDYGGYWRRNFADFIDGIILGIVLVIVEGLGTLSEPDKVREELAKLPKEG